jgi:hypothetical protein
MLAVDVAAGRSERPATTSGASAQPVRYARLNAQALFSFETDHGEWHPESNRSGTYNYRISYALYAIVAYQAGKVTVLDKNAIVGGVTVIMDERTKPNDFSLPPADRQPVPVCAGWEGDRRYQARGTSGSATGVNGIGNQARLDRFRRAPAAALTITHAGGQKLKIDPKATTSGRWGCNEPDVAHAFRQLQRGPSYSVPWTTLRSGLAQGAQSTYACFYPWSHPSDHPVHGHSFDGQIAFTVRLTPFPEDHLARYERELMNWIGRRPRWSANVGGAECPRGG